MRIKCPECNAVLSLGQPRPGTYQPRCKHCGEKFRLEISGDESPELKVSRLPTAKPNRRASSEPASLDHAGRAITSSGSARSGDDQVSATNPLTHDFSVGPKTARELKDAASDLDGNSANPVVPEDVDTELPAVLGGYRILRLLGRGAMGAVYEAKQVSLDRLVALKTLRGRIAENASSVARFTREAYAAAQLTHHNVVQIYDFGEDGGKHYFSMEWVRGGPLSELVQQKGVLDPRLAAGYILQAARGLQFAHRNGMVHRDVKPANLLLSEDGIVKVADLGLVKIPDLAEQDASSSVESFSGLSSGTEVTMQGTAVGTPAYMAPEQTRDSTAVDHRADIYSLGCSLFFLLTGTPPFTGEDAAELMQRHADEALPLASDFNPRVPQALQPIIEQATAKDPDDRYFTLAEMIEDLEAFLGVSAEGRFSPTQEQAERWEELARRYAASSRWQRFTNPLLVTLIVFCLLLTAVALLSDTTWLLSGPGMLAAALTVALALSAIEHESPLIDAVRRWGISLSWFDLVVGLTSAVAFLLVVLATGLLFGLIAGLVVGAACGFLYHFAITVPVREATAPVIADGQRFIRELRVSGADEEGLRLFAARYGGERWRPMFEALFGYPALRRVSDQLTSDPQFRDAFQRTTVRDRVFSWLRDRTLSNCQTRDHRRLASIEQRGLESEGLSEQQARDRAWQIAHALIESVQQRDATAANSSGDAAAEAKRTRIKAMLADARSGRYARHRRPFSAARFALSEPTRLLAGSLLLIVFAIWTQQTGLLSQLSSIVESAATDGSIDPNAVDRLTESAATVDSESGAKWSTGIAGILLVFSAFVSGWRMTLFAVPATIVILFGDLLGIPAIELPGLGRRLEPWMVSAILGTILYLPGYVFGESPEDRYW